MEEQKLKWYWHIHHDILLEPLVERIENRIKYIKENKPQNEIETRLKLLKPVRGKIPDKAVVAWKDLNRAYEDYDKAWRVCDKASKDYGKLLENLDKSWEDLNMMYKKLGHLHKIGIHLKKLLKNVEKAERDCQKAWKVYGKTVNSLPEVQSLHKKECPDCPWNGKSIF